MPWSHSWFLLDVVYLFPFLMLSLFHGSVALFSGRYFHLLHMYAQLPVFPQMELYAHLFNNLAYKTLWLVFFLFKINIPNLACLILDWQEVLVLRVHLFHRSNSLCTRDGKAPHPVHAGAFRKPLIWNCSFLLQLLLLEQKAGNGNTLFLNCL